MKELEELRDDTINESPLPPDGMPRGTETSDPTFNKTMKLLTCKRINQMYKTTYVIGNVVWSLPPDKQRLIKLKYWTNPQEYTNTGIAIQLHIDRATYFRWLNDILELIGRDMGLI